MKFLELTAKLEATIAELQTSCPGVNFIVVATDDEPFEAPKGNEYTASRNTPMSADQCIDFLSRAVAMAALGKGIFVKVRKTDERNDNGSEE